MNSAINKSIGAVKTFMERKTSLSIISLILSIYTLAAFHYPFFREVLANIDYNFKGILITAGLGVIMLALNFFLYYLLLFIGRTVGKIILALTFVADAACFYFIVTYNTLITDKMMGNFYNTQYSEASGFLSWVMLAYLLVLGGIPIFFIFAKKMEYGSIKRFLYNIGIALAVIGGTAGINYSSFPWINSHSTELGALLMPWSYTINSFRHFHAEKRDSRKEIPLPDARIASESKDLFVLIIGESARKANFSLYGYERKTNPYTEKDTVTILNADAANTYTRACVKAILDHKPSDEFYEILPNYLDRAGVDVTWRTTNWGEPKVSIEKYYTADKLQEKYPEHDKRYDGILLAGLKEEILSSGMDKILVIIHTNTSHGPAYNTKYPAEFEIFTPVIQSTEVSKEDPQALINVYDNSIVYTDWLIHSVIETLREIPDRRSCMMYVSDHGESLGEGDLFMHGVPLRIAPKEQLEIPFIIWNSDKSVEINAKDKVGQYHVFHSVLGFLGIESPVYDSSLDLFNTDNGI